MSYPPEERFRCRRCGEFNCTGILQELCEECQSIVDAVKRLLREKPDAESRDEDQV